MDGESERIFMGCEGLLADKACFHLSLIIFIGSFVFIVSPQQQKGGSFILVLFSSEKRVAEK